MRRFALGILLLVGLFDGPARAQDDDDPSVRGKKLTEWLKIVREDADPRKRSIGLLIAGQVGAKSRYVFPFLLKELRDNTEPAVRAKCAELLAGYKQNAQAIVEPLAGSLKDDKSPLVRESAATALGKLERDGFPAVPGLVDALKDADAKPRIASAEALGAFAGLDPVIAQTAIPNLIANLKHSDKGVRISAAFALGRFGPLAEDAVKSLGDIVGSDPDGAARKEAAKTLAAIGPKSLDAVPGLIKALRDAAPDVRQTAAVALSKIGPDAAAAAPELLKLLKDSDKSTRCHAIHALGSLGKAGLPAIPELIRMLKDDPLPDVRLAIIEELGHFGPDAKEAVDALTIASRDGRSAIRDAAQDALKKIQKKPDGPEM